MKNKNSKLVIIMLAIFETLFLINIISNIIAKDWKELGLAVLGIVNMLIPLLIKKILGKERLIYL